MGANGWGEMANAAQEIMKNYVKPEKLKEIASSPEIIEMQNNPKMQAIIQDVQTNGPMAVVKYYSDPEAIQMFTKISTMLGLPDMTGLASSMGMPPMPPVGGVKPGDAGALPPFRSPTLSGGAGANALD